MGWVRSLRNALDKGESEFDATECCILRDPRYKFPFLVTIRGPRPWHASLRFANRR